MYLTLEQAKKHLNLETEFTDDDNYITSLIQVAEAAVELHINQKLKDIVADNGGDLPLPLLHAILLMIGNFYANREAVSMNGKASEIPLSYRYLVDFYRKYSE